MDITSILTSVSALIFVLCLIGAISLIMRKYSMNISGVKNIAADMRKLKLEEVLIIDAKRKIVLVKHGEKEHLIAFSENEIEVIE